MATVRGRIRRLEKYVDAAFEKFVFHHKILGCLLIFIGIPLATLAAVCACSAILALPVVWGLGLM